MGLLINGQVGWRVAGVVGTSSGQDSDALAFITAATITNTTQQNAINTLVTDLKGYGIWSKMKAIYPFVGGNATSHKFNLKDPRDLDAAYRLAFIGGWTHGNGVIPNGTNAYANTFLTPSTHMTIANFAHLSYYSSTNSQKSFEYVMGGGDATSALALIGRRNTNLQAYFSNNIGSTYDVASNSTGTTGTGFLVGTQLATTIKLFRNNTLQASNTTASTGLSTPTKPIFFGCSNNNGVAIGFTDKTCLFSSIGEGLTDTESANLYAAVQTYQTTLGRQV